jgi:tetratricopeptide (TPR) repeat protein
MTIPGDPEQYRNDPIYREAMQAMQSGRWPEAIRAFESLLATYGESPGLRRTLDEARLRADLDAHSRVRERRRSINWRSLVPRVLLVAMAIVLGVVILRLVQSQVTPALAMLQNQQSFQRSVTAAHALLDAEKFDEAEAAFQELLAADPDNPDIQAALDQIDEKRTVHNLYQEGMAAQAAGDNEGALRLFQQVLVQASTYKDTSLRLQQLRDTVDRDALVQMAATAYEGDNCEQAIRLYEELRSSGAASLGQVIDERLFDCYMRLGRAALEQRPATSDSVSQAKDDFVRALALRPRSSEAALEEELATLFLAGQRAYANGGWDAALVSWQAVYMQRPDYLGGAIVEPMYDAYIQSGDSRRERQDYFYAYEQYRKAAELPVSDTSLAFGRMDSVRSFLTPTPTPTVTPTATPFRPPTPMPPATPPAPLVTYHNQIVFKSAKEDQSGFWLMNPDGSNRRYLGISRTLQQEYDALRKTQSTSPDGQFRVYVTTGEADRTPQVYIQGQRDQYGNVPTWRVTDFGNVAYDPVWSPDGSRIAFVSQQDGSDDIWVVYPDGSEPRNLTRNDWEWDKHPWWSPDGRRIIFWSNRAGVWQIYLMDANGQNLRRLSNTTWDEYEPIWIK